MDKVIEIPISSIAIAHITHCLEQVVKFSQMLIDGDTSRPRDSMLQQLAFNLGRFTEIAHVDGRAEWRLLESLPIQEYIIHAKHLLADHNAMITSLANEQLVKSRSSITISTRDYYANAPVHRERTAIDEWLEVQKARNSEHGLVDVSNTRIPFNGNQIWANAPIHHKQPAIDGWLKVRKMHDSEFGLMNVSLAEINGWIEIEFNLLTTGKDSKS